MPQWSSTVAMTAWSRLSTLRTSKMQRQQNIMVTPRCSCGYGEVANCRGAIKTFFRHFRHDVASSLLLMYRLSIKDAGRARGLNIAYTRRRLRKTLSRGLEISAPIKECWRAQSSIFLPRGVTYSHSCFLTLMSIDNNNPFVQVCYDVSFPNVTFLSVWAFTYAPLPLSSSNNRWAVAIIDRLTCFVVTAALTTGSSAKIANFFH